MEPKEKADVGSSTGIGDAEKRGQKPLSLIMKRCLGSETKSRRVPTRNSLALGPGSRVEWKKGLQSYYITKPSKLNRAYVRRFDRSAISYLVAVA
jgi:hypothetical protein